MNISGLNNFQQRLALSVLGICFSAVVIYFSHTPPLQYLFIATIATAQAMALSEYYALSKRKGFNPLIKLPIAASVAYIFLHYSFGPELIVVPFLLLIMAASFVATFTAYKQSIANLAITLFGLIYITIPLGFLLDINFQGSIAWLVYLLFTTKMTDTSAYIAGKTRGRHLLAPKLSPKKTIEGAVAGLLGSMLASAIFAWCFFDWLKMGSFEAIILGALIGLISQIGDLAESLLKRDAEVKDSSTLPGFGGMLDVVDSLIFTTPLLYFWLKVMR